MEKKCCTYEISANAWQKFIDEAVILHNILNWSQEDFEEAELEDYILDDTSYAVQFLLPDKTIEFRGSTSSKGIKLIRNLFLKYFEVPEGIKYIIKQNDCDTDII